ncbi:uncharacterized protein C18orf63 [Callorhinchus milii]|uniref:uncharacterized protein C18orf63 n=1 Tax=Callorhinchus milii TaxID=7868 RepID=UPI000457579A|nr:uncharacterized protein C18orf63 [Callorhinchus milii]|eukprot:gi/632970073/ref/XP_007901438.1/ PREDICTED: uncharacterized protein C18orf63 homolog [Callorhinchus milii]
MKGNSSFQSLFFIALPDLGKLCGVTATLNCDCADVRSAQIIMCRQLLFLHPEVLASPGADKEIIVVIPISFYKTGNIQAYIQKHGAKMDVPQRVIPAVLQTCLSYTLIAKLGPNWNKAGHLLIHGKDFLRKTERQNAVVMELNVSETQLCISVEASTIRLPLAKLEDFDISIGVLKNFYNNRFAVIPKHFISSNWCYVLPSMKKGQIVSVSHEIPLHCPFQSYGDFQKHWTNMYGYNLPEINDSDALYCTVYFKLVGERLFTYPFCCIRSEPVQFFPRVDLEGVLTAFISDLKTELLHICGFPVKMTNKPCYATNEFNVAQVAVQKRPPNLTTKIDLRPALTEIPLVRHVVSNCPSVYPNAEIQTNCTSVYPNAEIQTSILDNKHKVDSHTSLDQGSVGDVILYGSKFRLTEQPGVVLQNSSQKAESKNNNSTTFNYMMQANSIYNHGTNPMIIPIFKSKLLQPNKQFRNTNINEGKNKQYAKHVLGKLATLDSLVTNIEISKLKNTQEQKRTTKPEMIWFGNIQKQRLATKPKKDKSSTKQMQNSNAGTSMPQSKSNTNTGMMKPGITSLQTFGKIQQGTISVQRGGTNSTTTRGTNSVVYVTDSEPSQGSCSKGNTSLIGNQHKKSPGVLTLKGPLQQGRGMSLEASIQRNVSDKKQAEKRKHQAEALNSNPKKPKSKPVIQDVDMAQHAKTNQLTKLNSVTLHSWLKLRGIPVKAREKKEKLVAKIMEFINDPTS